MNFVFPGIVHIFFYIQDITLADFNHLHVSIIIIIIITVNSRYLDFPYLE